MTDEQWTAQLAYLERLRTQGRLYRGFVVPGRIPRDWPDDSYGGVANLNSPQSDRPGPPSP